MTAPGIAAAEVAVGFAVALSLGLTGMGGGTFTTPALVMLSRLPAGAAVGTSLAFTALVRLLAVPVHWAAGSVRRNYLGWLLAGALPGLVAGTMLLRRWSRAVFDGRALEVIAWMLIATALLTFLPKRVRTQARPGRLAWLALAALPVGFETGFSSAGSGAIGGLLLLNFSALTPREVVGTDLAFGLAVAGLGAGMHWRTGTLALPNLAHLVAGGVPGMLVGSWLARRLPARRLRPLLAAMALVLGLALLLKH